MTDDKNQVQERAIVATDHAAEAGRRVLRLQLLRMKRHEAGSRTGEDIESVHKMRVAVRRMRSLLELAGAFYQRKTVAENQKGLRKIARALGAVRDLDVLILDLQQFGATLSPDAREPLRTLIGRLDRRRQKRRQRLNAYLDSKGYGRSLRQLEKFATKEGRRARRLRRPQDPHELRHVLPLLLHRRLACVRAYDIVLPAPDDKRLHSLRVECKRLRYAVEFFAPVLGSTADDFLALVVSLQETLGRLNDIGVFVERLKRLDKLSPKQTAILDDYFARRDEERILLRATFYDQWARFNTRALQRKFSDALLVLR